MGIINSVTCTNKECRYHAELYQGPGMGLFRNMKNFEKHILSGESDYPDIKERIENGARIGVRGIYLCPNCKEFQNSNVFYLVDNITVSPYGTVRCEIKFPFEKPICEKCNSEMVYVNNVRSSKVKCPKCGSDLKARLSGYVD